MKRHKLIVLLSFLAYWMNAQLPNTDIWLFSLETSKTGHILTKPLNINNRDGYDNQPTFSTDGKKIYYVSIREDNQADIYYYDLKSKKTFPFTKTPESEYSPTFSPDQIALASVVVLQDSSQVILDLISSSGLSGQTKTPEQKQLSTADSVGYFTYLNNDTVVYYKLTSPHSLRYFVKNTNEDKWLANSPIRAFKAINRYTLLYGLKDSLKVTFYKYDFLLHKAEKYTEFESTNEDAIWHPTLGLLKSEENKLLCYSEQKKEWNVLFDFSAFGIKKITRFCFDPKNNYLVIVNNL